MIKRWLGSLYLKIFLSFLATCVLFFLGLALFWNHYFSDLFYKDKKDLLRSRSSEIVQTVRSLQDGSLSSREMRFALRLTSRAISGPIWIADDKGIIVYSSLPDREGQPLPSAFADNFAAALREGNDFFIGHLLETDERPGDNYLTYYTPVQLNGQRAFVFLHTRVDQIQGAISAVRWNIWAPLLFSLLAVGVILFTISRRLAGPLREMNRTALALAGGDFSARVPQAAAEACDEVGQLARSFNFMVEKLQQWEDTRQEFLTNVSHELRSPLTTLRGLIVALNDNVIPPDRHAHYLRICEQEVQRLQRLVTDLLDLARIQNGAGEFRCVRFDAVAKAKEVAELLAPAMEKKGLRFTLKLPDAARGKLFVELDPDRYAQILNNLLYNAMQYTPAGKEVSVVLDCAGDKLVLKVKDTGIGMSEEERKRIWDRFYKGDPSRRTSDGSGTGLGLTIVWHLVNGMNGTIFVESEPGIGTEFTVHFPLVA